MSTNILLVEDNPGDARLIVEMLRDTDREGFAVESVTTLTSALRRLGSSVPDVVLLDLSLPDSRGLDTFIRFQEAFPKLPAVILTGLDDEEVAVEAARAGVQDYFVKGTIAGAALARALKYAIERKRAQDQAEAFQKQLRRIVASVPGVIFSFVMRPDGSSAVPFCSSSLRDIFDISPETIKDNASLLFAAICADDIRRFTTTLTDSFRSLTPWHDEFRVDHAKRGRLWIKLDALPESEPDGSVIWHGFLIDNTERKQLESQLLQAQKMEAVGRLAGGVSHDFNNIMGIVTGYSDLIAESLPPSDANYRRITKIRDAAQRATALIRQLLAFSRMQVFAPALLDLSVHVEHLAEMLPRLLGEDIELIVSVSQGLWTVKADPSQIDQVILNLVINARDAMPQGGKLVIATRNAMIDSSDPAMPRDVFPGSFVVISVSDTGTGISLDVMPHIFDPFFTTKEMGKGTGLGLSTLYGIVRQSGGFISVDTKIPGGTTFEVYLPRHGLTSQCRPEHADSLTSSSVNSKTVLLTEDDDALREIVTIQLQDLGYAVLVASNAEEAIRIARDKTRNIDLLLTDVVMPGMNGVELANKLLGMYPLLKVLFVSGYSGDAISDIGSLGPDAYFLAKPVSKTALDERLRHIFSAVQKTQSPPLAAQDSQKAKAKSPFERVL